jgi:short-subunit dehydrogenase
MNMSGTDWRKRYPGWALVTGASSGIGAELARGLARRGMPVALAARREDRLKAMAQELEKEHGVETVCIPVDLTAPDMLQTLDQGLGERKVSVLINNAGFGLAEAFHQQNPATLRQMVELNCVAPVVLARHFVGPMVERRNGAIITVSSVAGFISVPYFTVYSATKVFDLFLGEALWGELQPFGVHSLAVCPGLTETEFQSVSGTNVKKQNYGAKASDVAEGSLLALGKKPTYIHGFLNKLTVFVATRVAPRRVGLKFAGGEGRKLLKADALQRLTEQEKAPAKT